MTITYRDPPDGNWPCPNCGSDTFYFESKLDEPICGTQCVNCGRGTFQLTEEIDSELEPLDVRTPPLPRPKG
jgi:hypothetical protein